MAFASAIIKRFRGVLGRYSLVIGTFTNTGGGIGGDVNTGLNHCHFLKLVVGGAAVSADEPVVNADFSTPVYGKAVPIVTTGDVDGFWIAFGT